MFSAHTSSEFDDVLRLVLVSISTLARVFSERGIDNVSPSSVFTDTFGSLTRVRKFLENSPSA